MYVHVLVGSSVSHIVMGEWVENTTLRGWVSTIISAWAGESILLCGAVWYLTHAITVLIITHKLIQF